MLPFFQGPYLFLNISLIIVGILFLFKLFDLYFFNILLLPSIAFSSLGVFYSIHGLFSKYVPGAYDNASGASMVLSQAQYFSQNKLKNTELLFINSSAEETYTRTVAPLAESLNLNKEKTIFLILDSLTSDALTIYEEECDDVGFNVKFDKKAKNYISHFVNQSIYKKSVWQGYSPFASDATMLVKSGFRVMSLIGSNELDGFADQYHQMYDTIEKTNYKTFELSFKFIMDLIISIDNEGYNKIV